MSNLRLRRRSLDGRRIGLGGCRRRRRHLLGGEFVLEVRQLLLQLRHTFRCDIVIRLVRRLGWRIEQRIPLVPRLMQVQRGLAKD